LFDNQFNIFFILTKTQNSLAMANILLSTILLVRTYF